MKRVSGLEWAFCSWPSAFRMARNASASGTGRVGECKNANFMHEKILKIKYKIFHLNVNYFLFHFDSCLMFARWNGNAYTPYSGCVCDATLWAI